MMKNRKGHILAKEALKQLIKKAGAEEISASGIEALRNFLMDFGMRISREAILLANHDKRKTVKRKDIELARSRVHRLY